MRPFYSLLENLGGPRYYKTKRNLIYKTFTGKYFTCFYRPPKISLTQVFLRKKFKVSNNVLRDPLAVRKR